MNSWLRSVYRAVVAKPVIGVVAEYLATYVWVKTQIVSSQRIKDLDLIRTERTSDNFQNHTILICRSFLFNSPSGISNWVQSIAESLVANSNGTVVVLCQSDSREEISWKSSRGYLVSQIPITGRINFEKLAFIHSWNNAVRNYLNNSQFNVQKIVAPLAGLEGLGVPPQYEDELITLLVTTHSMNRLSQQNSTNKSLDTRSQKIFELERNYLGRKKGEFVADSNQVIHDLEEFYGLNFFKSPKVIYIGFRNDMCEISVPDDTFLFIGRCDYRKDISTLLTAWSLFHQNNDDHNLIIVTSPGDDHLNWLNLMELRKANELNITVLLDVDESYKHKFLRKAKVTIVPSVYESFGMVAAEALMHGNRVIVTLSGGLPEVVSTDGAFFQPRDSNFRAMMMINFSSPQFLDDRLAIASRSRSRFSLETMGTNFINRFRD